METAKRIFEPVGSKADFPALEREVMQFWKEDDTFKESVRRREGAPRFIFYEGPPTANGNPGTHHILSRAFKDVFGRYRTMKGQYVERKAGWDVHGLPVGHRDHLRAVELDATHHFRMRQRAVAVLHVESREP